jgi:glycosyltransferase involved in cell wall biosynthesis
VIAGEGSRRAALQALSRGNPRVRFVGFQQADQLARLYAGAVAVIASSRGFETFGMSVIEAYSRGVPVLARRIGSYVELVEGSGAGEIFGDARELESAMRRFLADPARTASMGARAYERFRAAYSEDAVLPRYLQLVDRALGGTAAVPSLPTPFARQPA